MGKPVRIVKKKALTEVAIVGPMTIGSVGEIRDGLLKAFGFGKDMEISLAGITEIDVAGLQLLCSAHRTSVDLQVGFCVTGTGEELFSVAQQAGMLRQTGCVRNAGSSCIWARES